MGFCWGDKPLVQTKNQSNLAYVSKWVYDKSINDVISVWIIYTIFHHKYNISNSIYFSLGYLN